MTTLGVGVGLLLAVAVAIRGLWSPCGLSMISTITPLSERARGHRFSVTATWFVAGSILGGAVLGLVMSGGAWVVEVTGIPSSARASLVLSFAMVTVVSDLGIAGFALPNHPRQVDETWLGKYRPWVYAGGYGVQIGVGVATYIMTSGVLLLIGLGMLLADPVAALLFGGVFGLVRGLLIFVAARADSQDRLRRLHRAVDQRERTSRVVAIGAQVLVAVAAVAFAPSSWALAVPAVVGLGLVVQVARRNQRAVVPASRH